jgi:GTP-binding protein HflX
MLDKKKKIQQSEKAILVGLVHKDQTEPQLQEYLDELAFLAETAGAVAVKRFTQKLAHPDSRHFVGKGKLEEIRQYIQGKDITVVIFDDELTGAQINNIEKALEYYRDSGGCGNTLNVWVAVSEQEVPVRRRSRQTGVS